MINFTFPDMSDIDDEIIDEVIEAQQVLITKIWGRVMEYSPVLRGHFRASWRISKDAIDTSFTRSGGTEEAPLPRPTKPRIKIDRSLPIISVSNSIPYAEKIEDGYSDKAPAGVLALTLAELNL